ncbi:50S ribosomal protein L21 [Alkalibacter saccharofermentans]|jgi:large subunit ribosomal protein L21|uniref:Large ribosomal subunit protein bL21 n=1 Tax=Alkalibacter saccharofermentans DSM 14828 TaxID=1120975 RepID=A0A1M4V2G0_9FIRM|nr:50S ribosomal protein L21 [Alkalibacter saccharofermentans]SHE63119.1 large subunit ribosomal protein L21 [Alkalibacter saccharofermentans DSM 14828]
MYAVIKTGGKQYCVKEGDVIQVEKLNLAEGETVEFTEVLAVNNGSLVVGAPTVEGAAVSAEVVVNGKGKKVVIYKYKSKKDYRRKQGHRQPFTEVKITGIKAGKAE